MDEDQRSHFRFRLDALLRRQANFKAAYRNALRRLEQARKAGTPGEFIAAAMTLDSAKVHLVRCEAQSVAARQQLEALG